MNCCQLSILSSLVWISLTLRCLRFCSVVFFALKIIDLHNTIRPPRVYLINFVLIIFIIIVFMWMYGLSLGQCLSFFLLVGLCRFNSLRAAACLIYNITSFCLLYGILHHSYRTERPYLPALRLLISRTVSWTWSLIQSMSNNFKLFTLQDNYSLWRHLWFAQVRALLCDWHKIEWRKNTADARSNRLVFREYFRKCKGIWEIFDYEQTKRMTKWNNFIQRSS